VARDPASAARKQGTRPPAWGIRHINVFLHMHLMDSTSMFVDFLFVCLDTRCDVVETGSYTHTQGDCDDASFTDWYYAERIRDFGDEYWGMPCRACHED